MLATKPTERGFSPLLSCLLGAAYCSLNLPLRFGSSLCETVSCGGFTMHLDEEQLKNLKADLRRDLDAIERVEKLMAFKNGSLSPPVDERQYSLPVAVPMPAGSDDIEEAPARSLIDTIDYLLNSDISVRWTTGRVLAHLEKVGNPSKAANPIYSVGQAMQKLVDRGRLKVIRRGAGSAPNIYRGVGEESPVIEKSE
jgi:hypothetical protein